MSTDNIGATTHLFKLSRSGDFLFPASCLPLDVGASGPGRKGSKASCSVYQHADAVYPLVYSHWQVFPLNTPHLVEAVPDPNASHGCQSSPPSYNRSPTQSVVHGPHVEPRQGQCSSDSPWPDVSLDEEFLHDTSQDRYPPLFLTNDALSLAPPFLATEVGSPPLSEGSGAAFIPKGRKFSGFPTGSSPVANIVPCRQSREDRLDRGAWMPAISQAETNRYRDNDVEAIIPYGLHSSCLSHQPRRKRRSYPVPGEPYFSTTPIPSSSRPFPVYTTTDYSSSPPSQAAPQPQSRATNTEDRPEKKYRCSSCGKGFTQSQVLGRHVKDMHETRESCSHCLSFSFSRGRPYIYRKHLETEHPEIARPEVRQKASRYTPESPNLGARQAQSANYVPPLTRAAPIGENLPR